MLTAAAVFCIPTLALYVWPECRLADGAVLWGTAPSMKHMSHFDTVLCVTACISPRAYINLTRVSLTTRLDGSLKYRSITVQYRCDHGEPLCCFAWSPRSTIEVQIKVQKCGVCMTDVHMLDNGTVGNNIILKEPSVIGHEYSGYVTAVGSDVTNVKAGDRVTVDNLVACGHCARCKRGHTNVCFNHGYIGFPPEGRGGLARSATVPATCVHRIPATLDFEEAAMMEPLSVCVSAINRADVKLGDDVIVFGAGPIGLMTSQVARAKGASSVCVADISKERLELARELGATHTVLFEADETDSRTNVQRIRDTLGDCPDLAIECSGVPHCLRTSIYAVRPGGVVAVVGIGPDDVSIPIVDVALREIDIRGCVCNNYCFPASIKLVASEKVKVKPIISHRFRLEEVHHALDLVRERKVVKVMVDCSDD